MFATATYHPRDERPDTMKRIDIKARCLVDVPPNEFVTPSAGTGLAPSAGTGLARGVKGGFPNIG